MHQKSSHKPCLLSSTGIRNTHKCEVLTQEPPSETAPVLQNRCEMKAFSGEMYNLISSKPQQAGAPD